MLTPTKTETAPTAPCERPCGHSLEDHRNAPDRRRECKTCGCLYFRPQEAPVLEQPATERRESDMLKTIPFPKPAPAPATLTRTGCTYLTANLYGVRCPEGHGNIILLGETAYCGDCANKKTLNGAICGPIVEEARYALVPGEIPCIIDQLRRAADKLQALLERQTCAACKDDSMLSDIGCPCGQLFCRDCFLAHFNHCSTAQGILAQKVMRGTGA